MKSTPILLACALTLTTAVGCAYKSASIDGPNQRQKLSRPMPVTVTMPQRIDAQTFEARLDGSDVTAAFDRQGGQATLNDFVFEPKPGNGLYELSFAAAPMVNGKGRAMGSPVDQTLAFYPPSLRVQGNVGIGQTSRVEVLPGQKTSVMVKLPATPLRPTPLTISCDAADAVAIGDAAAGEPVTYSIDPQRRVAVFTVHGKQPTEATLRIEAPGYVAAEIDVIVPGQANEATAFVPVR